MMHAIKSHSIIYTSLHFHSTSSNYGSHSFKGVLQALYMDPQHAVKSQTHSTLTTALVKSS